MLYETGTLTLTCVTGVVGDHGTWCFCTVPALPAPRGRCEQQPVSEMQAKGAAQDAWPELDFEPGLPSFRARAFPARRNNLSLAAHPSQGYGEVRRQAVKEWGPGHRGSAERGLISRTGVNRMGPGCS